MTPVILAAGILPNCIFTIGGSSQQLQYNIGINPVTVPQDGQHVLKLILQILSPSNVLMYQNAGWNTSSFASPDSLTGTINLPPLTGTTTPESGQYKINIQAQYVDSTSAPVTTNATVNYLSAKVCVSCLPAAAIDAALNCSSVLLTITDTTNYCLQGYTYVGTTRVLTATPPVGSNQPVATTGNKVLQIDNGNEGNGILWNGIYTLALAAQATFTSGSTTIIQTLGLSQEEPVSCLDVRCQLYCALHKLETDYVKNFTTNPSLSTLIFQRYSAGVAEAFMVNQAIACGAEFDEYVTAFWKVTGLDPKCTKCTTETATGPVMGISGCGGSGGSGAPGPPGTPGSIWRTGSGVPSNTLGVNTDLYLDTATGNVYQRSAGVYALTCNIIGPQGDAGDTGPAGAPGATELWPQVINYQNTGAGASDVVVFDIPAGALSQLGDSVHIQAEVQLPNDTTHTVKFFVDAYQLPPTIFGQTTNPYLTYAIMKFKFFLTNITGVDYLNYRVDVKYTTLGLYGIANDLSSWSRTTVQIGAYTLGAAATFKVDFSSCPVAEEALLAVCEGINYKKA